MMKAITLKAHWAWAVAHAGKDVENRKTRCPSLLGERVAIHAGVDPTTQEARAREAGDLDWCWTHAAVFGRPRQLPYGCIVAVATIVGWVEGRTVVSAPDYEAEAVCHDGTESVWFSGTIGWLLYDVQTLAEPVPARGKQGIWTVDADVEARILAQLGVA